MKYYSIELLRVYFLILIIFGHTMMRPVFDSVFGLSFLDTMGSRVDIFMLICGFFLFKSLVKHPDATLGQSIKHRCIRILPVLLLYKLLFLLIFRHGDMSYFLSDAFMLNQNIGIDITTNRHIIWYVDVMFWVYLFYLALFKILKRHAALLITTIIMLASLVILMSGNNINLHFTMATKYLDGGLLRGFAFIGMGILLANIPTVKIKDTTLNKIIFTILETASLFLIIAYPLFFNLVTKGIALNHVLIAVCFVYLMVSQYGWLSRKLNNFSGIRHVSKYCYEIYVFQFLAITLGQKWLSPNQAPFLTAIGTVIIAYIFGVLAHNLYQKPLAKKLSKLESVSSPALSK